MKQTNLSPCDTGGTVPLISNSALDGRKPSASCPGRLIPRERSPRYALNWNQSEGEGLTAGLIVVDRKIYCPYRESNHNSKVVLVPIPNELPCLSNSAISYNLHVTNGTET